MAEPSIAFPAPLGWRIVIALSAINMLAACLLVLFKDVQGEPLLWPSVGRIYWGVLAGELSLVALAVGSGGVARRWLPALALTLAAWSLPNVAAIALESWKESRGGHRSFLGYAIGEYGGSAILILIAILTLAVPLAVVRAVTGAHLTYEPPDQFTQQPNWHPWRDVRNVSLALAGVWLGILLIPGRWMRLAEDFSLIVSIDSTIASLIFVAPAAYTILKRPAGLAGFFYWQGAVLLALAGVFILCVIHVAMGDAMRSGGTAPRRDNVALFLNFAGAGLGFTLTFGIPLVIGHAAGMHLAFFERRPPWEAVNQGG